MPSRSIVPLGVLATLLLLSALHTSVAFTIQSLPQRQCLVRKMSEDPAAPEGAPVACPNCDLCDGSGRIAGGLGAVIDWFPVKAYRPCPNFVNRGGNYQRSGQGLDEIAFSRDSTFKKDS